MPIGTLRPATDDGVLGALPLPCLRLRGSYIVQPDPLAEEDWGRMGPAPKIDPVPVTLPHPASASGESGLDGLGSLAGDVTSHPVARHDMARELLPGTVPSQADPDFHCASTRGLASHT
jgi:hypothetical protein